MNHHLKIEKTNQPRCSVLRWSFAIFHEHEVFCQDISHVPPFLRVESLYDLTAQAMLPAERYQISISEKADSEPHDCGQVRGGWWTVNISKARITSLRIIRINCVIQTKFIFAYQSQQNASHGLVGGKIMCFPSNMSPCTPQVRVDPSSQHAKWLPGISKKVMVGRLVISSRANCLTLGLTSFPKGVPSVAALS